MSDQTADRKEEIPPKHVHVIHLEYIDYANYYAIYGIATLIVLILLLWAYIRNHIEKPQHVYHPELGYSSRLRPSRRLEGFEASDKEDMPEPYTDAEYDRELPKGTYGDVTVYFNESSDNDYVPEWRKQHAGLYIHNSKSWWKDQNTPEESEYWE